MSQQPTILSPNKLKNIPKQREFLSDLLVSNGPKRPSSSHSYPVQIILDSASESTTHGIPHFVRRKNWLIRLMWAVCFLVSAGVCGYMIASSITSYLDYETVTKAQRNFLLWDEFPTVTICNQNTFLTNTSYEFVKSVLVANGLIDPTTAVANNLSNMTLVFEKNLRQLKYFTGANILANSNLTKSTLKSFGYKLDDILLSCTFNLLDCDTSYFEWYYDLFFGNCYKFNSGKFDNGSKSNILNVTRSGLINGLSVELFLYEPDNQFSLSSANGARILVHNRTTYPQFFNGIMLPSGSQAYVQVDRVFSSHMEQPYSDCVRNIDENYPSKFVKIILKTGYAYTQQSCFMACYQNVVIKQCGCYDLYCQLVTSYPYINQTHVQSCRNSSQIICHESNFQKFATQDAREICGNDCPLECDSIIYNSFTSLVDYPSRVYANSLINTNWKIREKYSNNLSELTYESLKRNMLQFSVFYGDLGYEQYEELAKMSMIDLVSNIGGTLGLFLGMSFLSVVEIFDVVLQILLHPKSRSTISVTLSPKKINH